MVEIQADVSAENVSLLLKLKISNRELARWRSEDEGKPDVIPEISHKDSGWFNDDKTTP